MLYEDIQLCDTPWMCQDCSTEAAVALKELPVLQEEVQSLRAESTGLREELSEMPALVTSLHSALSSLELKWRLCKLPLTFYNETPPSPNQNQLRALLKTPTTYLSLTKHAGHPMLMSPGKMVVDMDKEEVVAGLSIDNRTSKET